jgi:hypothetical protein
LFTYVWTNTRHLHIFIGRLYEEKNTIFLEPTVQQAQFLQRGHAPDIKNAK